MSDPNRQTAWIVYLKNVQTEPPAVGQLVFALGLGGKLCEEVWTSKSHEFFKAWMPYPKTPLDVKEELSKQYPFNDSFKLAFEKEVDNV